MATMQIKRMSFLMLLLLELFKFQLANAIPHGDIKNLCKETADAAFCLNSLESDPRIAAARDLSDVLLIAVSMSKIQVDDATTHLDQVSGQFHSAIGKSRIGVCRRDYGIASDRFSNAWENCAKKAFRDVNEMVNSGTNAVMNCEHVWGKDNPIQTSPLTFYNMKVSKMSGIIHLLVRKVAP